MDIELWVFITITAAFLQNIRSTFQKYLKDKIGTAGATFVRFGFGLPFAWAFLCLTLTLGGYNLPVVGNEFFFWIICAALAQIIAQVLLIKMFAHKNFAVGTAYSRTEPAQAALFGLIFLGDKISTTALFAIAVSVVGVMLISIARTSLRPKNLVTSIMNKTTLIGLCSGAFFGLAAVGFRGASLSLGGPNFMVQGALTLSVAITFQSLLLLFWIKIKEPHELKNIVRAWKPALLVGITGASASFGWFMAMTLQTAALVKGVAQIEVLFTFASSIFFFKEKINKLEVMGIFAITFGILILLFY